jgi:hypothetical protein
MNTESVCPLDVPATSHDRIKARAARIRQHCGHFKLTCLPSCLLTAIDALDKTLHRPSADHE